MSDHNEDCPVSRCAKLAIPSYEPCNCPIPKAKPTYEQLQAELEEVRKEAARLSIYIDAINGLDDYFEYMHESEKDKEFVMGIIDSITIQLTSTPNK